MDSARSMEESEAVAFDLLQDEAFATKETRADALRECDRHVDTARRAEEGVFLGDDAALPFLEIDRLDLTWKRRRERRVLPFVRRVGEGSDEEGITGERSLGALHELPEDSPALLVGIERRVHDDAFLHVHHRPRLGDHCLAWVERHDDGLEVVADDLVVDLVAHVPVARGWMELWPLKLMRSPSKRKRR